ncbi:major facilitator superfamily domain-containing protein [Aspergillus granulosus]|uniref:Major facilitator superfamily domain-containing protein n=1 Tax=Aspergillus granulosus TaxID=176169 RepID=A0ABR4I4D3_9EURO
MNSAQTLSLPVEGPLEKQQPEKQYGPEMKHKRDDLVDFPDGGWRAWGVALGNSGVMLCTLGYVNSWGVYQAYYQGHQLSSSTSSAISWIGSLQTFFMFSASLVGGPLFDRYGAKVIYPPAVIYIFTVFMTSICKEYYQFMLCQGILSGISSGLLMAPTMAATPQYFNKKRGAAMGLAVAGSSIGGVIFPIALNRMLTRTDLGFGWSVRVVAFLILGILLVSCPPIRARLPPRETDFLLLRAFGEPGYTTLIIGAFFMFLGMFPPIFYLPSYGLSQGMTPTTAFYLSAILNAASFPGRIIPAILSDKFGKLNTFAGAGITTGILTLCWQRVSGSDGVIAFTAIFGFFSGAIISGGTVALASCASDAKNIGTYMGMGMAVVSIAPLTGPPISGALEDTSLGFKAVSIFAGVVGLFGGVFTLFVVKLAGGKKVLSLE